MLYLIVFTIRMIIAIANRVAIIQNPGRQNKYVNPKQKTITPKFFIISI